MSFSIFKKKENIIKLILFILAPLLVGALSSYLTQDTMVRYQNLNQPAFAPPGWIFPIVWTLLYIMMGVASFIVYMYGFHNKDVKKSLIFYDLQLIFNFFWSIIFFRWELRGFALLWLIILLALIIITTINFYKVNKYASYLMIPYILWVCFAGILNYAVWQLNL
ncbi:TspO/MBR related protein [Natranaerovirga hydrolytica]|uniref:TspO/MBR related protein n=1 Tax=Natranaerovirga hydrolytica TaxID=680378 RepID=A0A4R1MZW1_9FIRM|nr:TspO/MBR family protein [Natranaerovirga hydrolytica]TCK98122.1 TspO/MBR related protein [Natranaerovirga hydrolytica]